MANRSIVQPFFAVPPPFYNQAYMYSVVRAFSVFLNIVMNPGDIRATTLVLTDLPSSDSGLEPGALFVQGGYVLITEANRPHPGGVESTGAVGTVTVVIS